MVLKATLRSIPGVWLGWSGEVECTCRAPRPSNRRCNSYIVTDLNAGGFRRSITTASPTACCGRSSITGWIWRNFRAAISPAICASTSILPTSWYKVLKPDDIVWVHDYHLIPLAKACASADMSNRIGFFLHIPFPPPEILTAMPNHERLIPALGAL